MKFLAKIGTGLVGGVMLLIWLPIVLVIFLIALPFLLAIHLRQKILLHFRRKLGDIAPNVPLITLPDGMKLKELSKFYTDYISEAVPTATTVKGEDGLVYFITSSAAKGIIVEINYDNHEPQTIISAYEGSLDYLDEGLANEIHDSLLAPDCDREDALSAQLAIALLKGDFKKITSKRQPVYWIQLKDADRWYKVVLRSAKNVTILSGFPSKLHWYKNPDTTHEA